MIQVSQNATGGNVQLSLDDSLSISAYSETIFLYGQFCKPQSKVLGEFGAEKSLSFFLR